MRKLLLLLGLSLFAFKLFAEGVIVLTETNKNNDISLKGNLFYYIDTTNQLTFNQILAPGFKNQFTQTDETDFFYPGKSYNQWYKFEIANKTNEHQQLILNIGNPLIHHLTFFSSTDSTFYHTGLKNPYHQRQVNYKNFGFKIKLKPGQIGTFCLKVDNQEGDTYVPLAVLQEREFLNKLRNIGFFNGIFYAFTLLMLFIVYLLWTTEKDKVYLYFVFFLLSFVLYNLWREEILFEWIWPKSPMFNILIGRVIYPLSLFFIVLFINQIFKTPKRNKKLRNLHLATIFLGMFFILSQFFVPSTTYYTVGIKVYIILIIVTTLLTLLVLSRSRKHYSRLFNLALIALFVSLVLETFFDFNVKGLGVFDEQLSTIVILIFFITIVYIFLIKFKQARFEVVSLNKNLEQLVEKRTYQLSAQKDELRAQHEELILQKETLQTQREELRAQKELLEIKNVELEKLSLVASKTDNLIYIFRPNGELDWYNTSFSRILGMSLEEYKRGEPISIIDVSTNKNIRHVLNTCLREKTVVSYESVFKSEKGEEFWYHTTLTPIIDERENIKHLIAIDTDISRLKQYEREIHEQREDAEIQKNLAVSRKEELEERQVEITDSIRYAKRIQTAIMPKVKQIQRDFSDSFVLFLPKDIVSGDFYWYHRIKDKYFVAAVDCTGHGVPGAFMSIIGNYLLNSIIIHNGIYEPSEILKQLNRKIKIALKSDNRAQTSDGMDIALAVIDKNENTLEFASALRPLYLFNEGRFIEVKGDKIPITSSISGTTINNFTTHTFDFKMGDMFYIFSDGIIDQFGGERGKKFLTKRFKQLLFEINPLTMREQKEIIKKSFYDWKMDNPQVDDVLVMGLRYTEDRK